MWYDPFMPGHRPIPEIVEEAERAVAYAQEVRKFHRRRTRKDSAQRATDIDLALKRIRDAMKPLRHEIGRFPYAPPTKAAENNKFAILAASKSLQSERRKLWKMQARDRDHAVS